MTRLGDYLNFQIGTVKKQHKIDKHDQGKITDGKIAAYSLVIQPRWKHTLRAVFCVGSPED